MQNHYDDTIKTSDTVLLKKYTSHFIERVRKGYEGYYCVWEGIGDRTELQNIDPNSYGHNSVSFPFSWAAHRGPGGPASLGAGSLYHILYPTDWTSCAPSNIIVRHPPSSCGRHKSYSFKTRPIVKVISWYSSTGFTCYLHRWISYFDSLAGVNMLHQLYF